MKVVWASLLLVSTLAACRPEAGDTVAVGTLERDRLELIAEEQEQILEIAVREGDVVETGALLVRLDDRLLSAALASAEATRREAEARLAELTRGARPEEIEEARARLEEAKSAIGETRPELTRARALVASEVEPPARLEQAEAALGQVVARRDAAAAALERLLGGTTAEELDQARARVDAAEAAAEERRLRRERLRVTAPRPGRIDALPYEVGERPPRGATVAVLLAAGAPYARVYLPTELRARARVGDTATVAVEGFAQELSGRFRRISSEAAFTPFFALTEEDRGRLTYLAEVDLVAPEAADLPTGLPVVVTLGGDSGREMSAHE